MGEQAEISSPKEAADNALVLAFGLLQGAANRLEYILGRALERECGISHLMFEVLLILGRTGEPGMPMRAIAQEPVLTTGGVTRLVDRMEAAGLVERATWIDLLDEMAALRPELVVPGHRLPDTAADASAITATRRGRERRRPGPVHRDQQGDGQGDRRPCRPPFHRPRRADRPLRAVRRHGPSPRGHGRLNQLPLRTRQFAARREIAGHHRPPS